MFIINQTHQLIFSGDIKPKICVAILTGVTAVTQWSFILRIVDEITTILGIEVFVTKQEQAKR